MPLSVFTMANAVEFLLALFSGTNAAELRDVPLGECHGCEVTCFEDCSLKYYREIMADDMLLQVKEPVKKSPKNGTSNLTNIGKQYAECLKDDQCPCPKEDAKAAAANSKDKKALLQTKNSTCSLAQGSCALECSRKVVSKAHAKLDAKKKAQAAKKKTALMFLEKDYPIHSVQVGVFSKGHMNLAECHKFCLAATCGCDKTPGLDSIDKLFKAIKANDAAEPGEKDFSHRGDKNNEKGGGVIDTHSSYQFRPAKIEECAKGIIGKKVSKGLWIDFGFGLRGEREVCSKEMLEKVFGPGDHKNKKKLCASTKSDDAKWGCVWNEKKGFCGVGFSPNLHCLKRYINDPSKLL